MGSPLTNTLLPVLCLAVLLASTRTWAQSGAREAPDVSRSHVRVGRLLLNPTIALTNLGVDTNVFNESDETDPSRDFTLTVTPQTDVWLRMGRSWVTGNIKSDLVWYKEDASERAANNTITAAWLVPLNRMTFDVSTSYLHTHDRPGFEIDARSRRKELAYDGSMEIRARPKTFVGLRGGRRTVDFDDDATFEDVSLREALNRTVTTGAVTMRQQLTPLTAVTLEAGRSQDRFEFSPERNSDSTAVSMGVTLNRFALVKGHASLGYRDFQPVSSSLPAYTGITANADLSYVAFGTTRLAVRVIRDLDYSFDIDEPYYLLTGVSGSIQRRVFRPIDVIARFALQRLNYRQRIDPAVVPPPHRIDTVDGYGGGLGYHMGRDVRIGFDVDQQHRNSPVQGRAYHGLRFGTSVAYGF